MGGVWGGYGEGGAVIEGSHGGVIEPDECRWRMSKSRLTAEQSIGGSRQRSIMHDAI